MGIIDGGLGDDGVNFYHASSVAAHYTNYDFFHKPKTWKGACMSITVNIPTILRPLTNNQKRIEISSVSVLEAIEHMEQRYPGVKEKLITEGKAHRFVNIYVNDDDIRFSNGLSTRLKDGDSLTILPAVAGG